MMGALVDPVEVRQALTARIEALTPLDAYKRTNGAWRQARHLQLPEFDPDHRAHLSFFVLDNDVEDTDLGRGSSADPLLVRQPVSVRFLAKVTQKDQASSWDDAGVAATHLMRWLLQEDWPVNPPFTLHPARRLIRRRVLVPGEWLDVQLNLVAQYHLSVAQEG